MIVKNKVIKMKSSPKIKATKIVTIKKRRASKDKLRRTNIIIQSRKHVQFDTTTKYAIKKAFRTCRRSQLEYEGPYALTLLKRIDPEDGFTVYYVETADHQYCGMLDLDPNEVKEERRYQYLITGGIIKNKKYDCYYMSKYDNSDLAIRKAVNWARIYIVSSFIGMAFVAYALFSTFFGVIG